MAKTIKRTYSKEQTIGDIIYNKKSKTVFFSLNLGFMGRKNINLVQNAEGTYDMFGTYFKDNKPEMYKMGKTFQVTDRNGNVVEGLTQGTLGLSTTWNKELQKEVTSTENALFFVTHKLRETKVINDDLVKVGWVTGKIGVEIETEETPTQEVPQEETPTVETEPETSVEDDDEVPF